MTNKTFSYLAKLLCLFIAYFLSARIGLLFDTVGGIATLIWIPSGLALAVIFLFDRQLWPAIALGAFFVSISTQAHISSALLIATGNTLEILSVVSIFRRFRGIIPFARAKDVYFFIFAIAVGASIASTFGATSIIPIHGISKSSYFATFGAWWLGDFISMLLFTPFILTWIKKDTELHNKFSFGRFFEACILTICVTVLTGFIYLGGPGYFKNAPKAYLIFPFIIWSALSFGMKGATAIMLLLFAIAVSGTILGLGPLVDQNVIIRLALVQGFLIITAITSYILAAVNNERNELDRRKDDFISMASHELKTPLTSTKIFIQLLLKQSNKNAKTTTLLKRINLQIDKLGTLINDLLDVTKIEQGKLELKNEIIHVPLVLKDIVEELQLTTNHKLILHLHTKTSIFVDKQRFHQIISNLVMNAIKFSPERSKIIISAKKYKNTVVISVEDFGIGIPKTEQIYMFDRFYQIKKDNRDTYPGVGLGLFIVKEIITRMGGKIWVESEEKKGATFYFSIPVTTHKKN